ncbi:MAG TPA: zf-HC2 domain-containing protein, partial [Ktedonobacterales bacterium]
MIEQDVPACALGLTTDILSAWRDGGFRGDEEQRIRQHAATCAACQRRLDEFVAVAHALERQRELEPGDRIWSRVQNRIASQRRTGIILPRSPGRSWQGVLAAASVILVVSLLAYVFNAMRTQRSGPAPASTAT